MRVRIPEEKVVEFFRMIREAERTVDAVLPCSLEPVLGGEWKILRDYYAPRRLADIRRVIQELNSLVGNAGADKTSVREQVLRLVDSGPSLVPLLFGKWTVAWKRRWSFGRELRFFADTLQELVDLLSAAAHPNRETVIRLRMNLTFSVMCFDSRCYGSSGLDALPMIYPLLPKTVKQAS